MLSIILVDEGMVCGSVRGIVGNISVYRVVESCKLNGIGWDLFHLSCLGVDGMRFDTLWIVLRRVDVLTCGFVTVYKIFIIEYETSNGMNYMLLFIKLPLLNA